MAADSQSHGIAAMSGKAVRGPAAKRFAFTHRQNRDRPLVWRLAPARFYPGDRFRRLRLGLARPADHFLNED